MDNVTKMANVQTSTTQPWKSKSKETKEKRNNRGTESETDNETKQKRNLYKDWNKDGSKLTKTNTHTVIKEGSEARRKYHLELQYTKTQREAALSNTRTHLLQKPQEGRGRRGLKGGGGENEWGRRRQSNQPLLGQLTLLTALWPSWVNYISLCVNLIPSKAVLLIVKCHYPWGSDGVFGPLHRPRPLLDQPRPTRPPSSRFPSPRGK